MPDPNKFCEHEDTLRANGWTPEIKLVVWMKDGEDAVELHYDGPSLNEDQKAMLITYIMGIPSTTDKN